MGWFQPADFLTRFAFPILKLAPRSNGTFFIPGSLRVFGTIPAVILTTLFYRMLNMQITEANYIQKVQTTTNSGNVLPSTGKVEPTKENSFIHELAKSIEPSNMSRNDARAIGNALIEADGDFELASSFFVQSMVLVRENGNLRNATESDAIMNEKFNMFDSLKGQKEYNRNHNISTESLEEVESFLHKLQVAKSSPVIDTYT